MYIIQPDHSLDQWVANRINAEERHCRIGKVRHKTGVPWADRPSKFILPAQPVIPGSINNHPQPWWMQGPWCNQATGGGMLAS
jgi:hypothetical protein